MTQTDEQVMVNADGVVEQGIVPIVEHLKAHEFKVLYWADVGDEVFRSPRIWVYDEDDGAGLHAVEVCREFARQRGYELSHLQREWNYTEGCPTLRGHIGDWYFSSRLSPLLP